MLLHNWRDVLKRAWSIRLIVLAGMLSGVEIMLPYYSDSVPAGVFAGLSFVATAGAFWARIVAQRGSGK